MPAKFKGPFARAFPLIQVMPIVALFLFLVARSAWKELEITRHQLDLEATVIERTSDEKNGPRIRFIYELEGVRYTTTSETEDVAAVPGARIPIEIDRTHPERSRPAGGMRLFPWVATFVGLVLFVLLLAGVWLAFFSPTEGLPWVYRRARKRDNHRFEKDHLQERHRALTVLEPGTISPIAKTPGHPQAKIVGRLRYVHRPLVAPLSKKPCAGYQLLVESQHDGEVRQVLCEARMVDFLVEDETGAALVRAAEPVSLALVKDIHECSLSLTDLTPEMTQLFSRAGQLTSVSPQAGDPLCFREGVLTEGERVMVVGEGRWEADPSPEGHGYRESAQRLVMAASPGRPLVISDDPEATAGGASGDVGQAGGPGGGGTSGRAAG